MAMYITKLALKPLSCRFSNEAIALGAAHTFTKYFVGIVALWRVNYVEVLPTEVPPQNFVFVVVRVALLSHASPWP